MTNPDWESLDSSLANLSPQYYQEFRQLYNELLGYIERNDTEKINAFSARLNNSLHRSVMVYDILERRMRQFKNNADTVQKATLSHRFKHPPETIPVSHAYPLPSTPPLAEPELKKPLPKNKSSSEKKSIPMTHTSQALHDLSQSMAEYNAKRGHVQDSGHSASSGTQLNPSPTGRQTTHQTHEPQPLPVDDGVSLDESFYDPSIYIQKKSKTDTLRANQLGKSSSDKPHDSKKTTNQKDPNPNQEANKKDRIWTYIKNNQQPGGISHDL